MILLIKKETYKITTAIVGNVKGILYWLLDPVHSQRESGSEEKAEGHGDLESVMAVCAKVINRDAGV